MRIYIKTLPSNEVIPFDYQHKLVSAFHKWLGNNSLHDATSLYSISWLNGGIVKNGGLQFSEGTSFFISAYSIDIIKRAIEGIQYSPVISEALRVHEIILRPTPNFSSPSKFILQSPILIKRSFDKNIRFFFPGDIEADKYMTETLQKKLSIAGIEEEVSVEFDKNYARPRKKLCTYKGIQNKASLCPVIVKGNEKAIAFAWDVGIGNSTGIGFGAVK